MAIDARLTQQVERMKAVSDGLVDENKEEEGYVVSQFEKMICKVTEIQSMMRNGEFIVAYEKLGGVLKNLQATGGLLQRRFAKEAVAR